MSLGAGKAKIFDHLGRTFTVQRSSKARGLLEDFPSSWLIRHCRLSPPAIAISIQHSSAERLFAMPALWARCAYFSAYQLSYSILDCPLMSCKAFIAFWEWISVGWWNQEGGYNGCSKILNTEYWTPQCMHPCSHLFQIMLQAVPGDFGRRYLFPSPALSLVQAYPSKF